MTEQEQLKRLKRFVRGVFQSSWDRELDGATLDVVGLDVGILVDDPDDPHQYRFADWMEEE
jgi:hypothetical protein